MATMSDDEFAPKKIASAEFPTAFRGYDPDAVRSFLSRLATALEETGNDGLAILARTTTQDRIEELEEENETLRGELRELELESVQRTVSDDADDVLSDPGEIDEHRAIELLGQETARVLESARSAAADIIKRSESDASEKLDAADQALSAARKEARGYLTDKQAEVEELVARVTSEAEESAQQVRDEADEHRQMVLDESTKILSDAEASAEESERGAQARAEQIVADAEAIRQQILSELVVERTKSQTDLEEMASTRDRLAMALKVARSEIDEMSDRLEEITTKSDNRKAVDPDAADTAGLDASVDDEVARLAAELDGRLGIAPAGSGSESGADEGSATTVEAEQTVIDLTGEQEGSGKEGSEAGQGADGKSDSGDSPNGPTSGSGPAGRSAGGGRKTSKRSKAAKGRTRKRADGNHKDSEPAGQVQTATATAVAERPADSASDAAEEADSPADTEQHSDSVQTEAETETEGAVGVVSEPQTEETTVESSELTAEESEAAEAEKQRIATGLIEGFTTIELSEADINLASEQQRGEPEQELSNIITTVESRSRSAVRGADHDINRGDLRIEGADFRGKLLSAFVARDKALKGLDDVQRAMRRVVNDDQSDVLDRIRGGKGRLKVDELAPLNQQLERYLVPVHRGLLPVGLAGARVGGKVPDAPGALERLEQAVARYIVDRLRIPVIQLIEEDDTDDREAILDPIRSVYRDFRNGSLIDLVEDSMYEAFAIGVFAAIKEGTQIAWLLDPRYDPDPACEINAGRDGLTKGEAFPSGHARPLAVPSCRCLVVAT